MRTLHANRRVKDADAAVANPWLMAIHQVTSTDAELNYRRLIRALKLRGESKVYDENGNETWTKTYRPGRQSGKLVLMPTSGGSFYFIQRSPFKVTVGGIRSKAGKINTGAMKTLLLEGAE